MTFHRPVVWSASLALALAASCSSPNPKVPHRASASELDAQPVAVSTQSPDPGASARPVEATIVERVVTPVVARVDGEEIDVTELLASWMHADSQGVRDLLERIISSKIVEREAAKLGVVLDEQQIRDEMARTVAELERELQLSQPGMTLDEWISRGLGLDPEPYRERLLEDVRRRLLAERIVRVFIYTQEWAEARVIVVEKRAEAEALIARLAAGEPFGRLANEASLDPTGKYGGRIPPVLRNESAVARLAFSLEPGAVGGPILESGRWMVLGLDALHEPLEGEWSELEGPIEASLAAQPIEDPEYWMWKVEMNRVHPVDLSPLLRLVGEADGRQTPER